VLSVERKLIEAGHSSFWTFCVEYLDGPLPLEKMAGKVDYKEVLSAEQFARFARLRELRKGLAEKEAVPPYVVFTNEQLAQMVKLETPTAAAVEAIEGIGAAKMGKYGRLFLEVLAGETPRGANAKGGEALGTDRRT
jgi:superfamily II DNA helicase RecQ